MGMETVSFQTVDNVTLRGSFHVPANYSGQKLPCVVISHGFSAVKEGGLTAVADYFTANLPITCLVYDNRGFGESDTGVDQPRLEVDAAAQTKDISDAITYSQTRPEVDPAKIGIWGSSFSGGNVLWVAAVDRRVKAVVAQAPLVDGWSAFANLLRSDELADWEADFQKGSFRKLSTYCNPTCLIVLDRIGRATGKSPMMIPVVDSDPLNRSAMTTKDSQRAMGDNETLFPTWRNEVTLKR
jgi:cephalosporin-C deacetylase-like acetyl esterase